MFVLRRITSENNTSNTVLGNSYNTVFEESNEKEFAKTLTAMKWSEKPIEVYGFVIYEDGSKIMPLYKKSTYFVMLSDGKTFDNLTFK